MYCEASMGSQEQKTAVVAGCNPHWNSSMQFLIRDLQEDILCLTVFDRDFFSPNGKYHSLGSLKPGGMDDQLMIV